jgi:hypothetical protein
VSNENTVAREFGLEHVTSPHTALLNVGAPSVTWTLTDLTALQACGPPTCRAGGDTKSPVAGNFVAGETCRMPRSATLRMRFDLCMQCAYVAIETK